MRRESAWRLYHVGRDRTETRDVAAEHPGVLEELQRHWLEWAERMGIPSAQRR